MHSDFCLNSEFFRFFEDLKKNNNREWFAENKARYQQHILEPLKRLVIEFAPALNAISPHYQAIPKANGGSIFRIYRDVRFSKDKRPYKEHGACQFRHELGKDAHAPGFYLHMQPDSVFFGGGIWMPPNPVLHKIRERIADNPNAWGEIRSAAENSTVKGISGDGLTRPPKGFSADVPHLEDIKRKSFFCMAQASPDLCLSKEFLPTVEQAFRDAAPLLEFVCDALGVPF